MEKGENILNSIAEDNNISIGLVKKYYDIIKNNTNITNQDDYYYLRCLNLLIKLREKQNEETLNITVDKVIDKINSNKLKKL